MKRPERVDPYDRPEDTSSGPTSAEPEVLESVRAKITHLDGVMVSLLAERTSLARSAFLRKRAMGLEMYDASREAAVVRHAATKASELGLDPEEVRELFWRIVRMSRELQRDAL